jgi:2-polyprenyl-3-methyl-5-hydroxy-6-metoxy-1,4-benzoquinol methylase
MRNKVTFGLSSCAAGLKLGGDGIWYAADQEAVSYPSNGNDQCFEIEDKSFWFQHRNACIVELVKKFPPRGNGPIFDVGGGNGFVAKGLMDAGWNIVLVEPGPSGVSNAKARGLQNIVCATTQVAGFKPGSMPAIGVFDVVEHIEDDVGFVRHLHKLLEPDGMLYLTVPAYNFLWSEADVSAGHFRRYSLGSLDRALNEAGFTITFGTYFFRVLPLGVFLYRSLPYRMGMKGRLAAPDKASRAHGTHDGLAVRAMRSMLVPEISRISKARKMHFGGSCLVAARREN